MRRDELNEPSTSSSAAAVQVLFENRELALRAADGAVVDAVSAMGTRAYRRSKLPPPPPPATAPLLGNGGFELASSVGVPDGVYALPQGDLGASFLVDARIAAAGRHSLRLTTPTAGEGVALLFSSTKRLEPPTADAAPVLNLSLTVRSARGGSASMRFGLRPQGDVIAPCCKPGAAVQAAGTGAFEMLSKAISVPPGCDLSRCSVTVELLSQGIVYIDEVRLEWSS